MTKMLIFTVSQKRRKTGAELNTEIEMQTNGTASTTETDVMEWLMVLVSENGELQVLSLGVVVG